MKSRLLNILKNPKILVVFLLNCMKILPDKIYLKIRYRIEFKKKLDIKNPRTFNEKLNWLKLYDRKLEYKKMVDKYDVRQYIADKIGEEYLIPLLGIWDNFDDIDFDKLPEQFVLKCTHDSGSVVVCKDKKAFDYTDARRKIKRKQKKDLFWWGREWPYKDLSPRIIAEKYMKDEKSEDLVDYKFFCFNGEPKFIYISENLSNHELASISFFDLEFNSVPFKRNDFRELQHPPVRPVNFEKMVELSKILSKNHIFLRVDFYEINGKIYFGELTFFPAAGYLPIVPYEWDEKLGDLIRLNNDKNFR